ncbi:hypothetical protein GMORB2_7608 [Geosmithia morbida]|uniref:Uncharacterized protein n=1 Tax=Geosmithia morbida TaxID=1094350 RepID=A0A9P5D3Q2_9HYPO|nr:uncharacterized protein GMORB2_7608 [Geosmithia morbida]KAF4122015.1 hypothetical protein GMORB2_7608 [Geosmithia morbida]
MAVRHIRLQYQCGICGGLFSAGEKCVGSESQKPWRYHSGLEASTNTANEACQGRDLTRLHVYQSLVLGNSHATEASLVTDAFPFTAYGTGTLSDLVNGWLPCWMPDCKHCAPSPESVTIHHDCFKVFLGQCIKAPAGKTAGLLDSLWRFTAWRVPWKGAPALFLEEDDLPMLSKDTLEAVSSRYGTAELSRLPPELVRIVKRYSEDAVFWRIVAAADLARRFVGSSPITAATTMPLSDIASWDRGQGPVVLGEAGPWTPSAIIRLAIDSHGLRSVERFSEDSLPTFNPKRISNVVFVVEPVSCFKDVLAIFQDMFVSVGSLYNESCLCTIDLDKVTGLTFVMRMGRLIHIHGHTRKSPLTVLPPSSTSRILTFDGYCWIYVPLADHDVIKAMRVEQAAPGAFQISLKTKLVGTVTVGTCLADSITTSHTILRPRLLVYNRREARGSSLVGAYSPIKQPDRELSESVPDMRPTLEDSWPVPFSGSERYFSFAKLDAVRSATVFSEDGNCTGILFRYENGGRRAVGQCPMGHGEKKEYLDPLFVCIKKYTCSQGYRKTVYHSRVAFFGPEGRHKDSEDGDTPCCHGLSGALLKFWFSHKSTYLQLMKRGIDVT